MNDAPVSPVAVGIAGAGRMGQALAASVEASDDLVLAGVWRRGHDLGALAAASDVLVDFSLPEATEIVVAAARGCAVPLVCGVSGLGDTQQAALERAAEEIAVLDDRNMSLGIAVLAASARRVAVALGGDFDVVIRETHHVHKLDAPSGTALKLGEIIAAGRDVDSRNIDYEVERRGDVPGDHEVEFTSPSERLTLAHSVTTRQVFVDGALRAARWILAQPPGRYGMHDVLGVET